MLIETDEIFVWTKKGKECKVFRLKTNQETKRKIINAFNDGIKELLTNDIGKDRERINFESHYYADLKEELLMIQNFKVPQELLDAFDQPDLLDCFEPNKEGKTKENYEIKAIIIGRKEGENYFFACQKFTPKKW